MGRRETFYDIKAFDVTFFYVCRLEKEGGGFLGVGTSPAIIMLHLLSHSGVARATMKANGPDVTGAINRLEDMMTGEEKTLKEKKTVQQLRYYYFFCF